MASKSHWRHQQYNENDVTRELKGSQDTDRTEEDGWKEVENVRYVKTKGIKWPRNFYKQTNERRKSANTHTHTESKATDTH